MNPLQDWLVKYQTNGVSVDMPELMAYRSYAHWLNLSPSRDIAGALSGADRSKIKGRGMEFDEARHYQPGDDIRSIDWRVTARTGRTHTKVFREERDRPVFVCVDLSRSMQFGTQFLCKSVQASHLAALITWNAVQRGDKIGGLFFNDYSDLEQKPKAQAKSALTLLKHLSEIQQPNFNEVTPANPECFLNAIKRLQYLAKPGALVYLISDFSQLCEASMGMISRINRHCEVKALLVNDPMELSLPQSRVKQDLSVTDGQQRAQVRLGESASYTQYQRQQAEHFAKIKQAFDQYAITCRSVTSAKPLELQLRQQDVGEKLV